MSAFRNAEFAGPHPGDFFFLAPRKSSNCSEDVHLNETAAFGFEDWRGHLRVHERVLASIIFPGSEPVKAVSGLVASA